MGGKSLLVIPDSTSYYLDLLQLVPGSTALYLRLPAANSWRTFEVIPANSCLKLFSDFVQVLSSNTW